MYNKTTKELLPEADGNIAMMRNTILEYKKYRPDDMFFVLLPAELSDSDKMCAILPNGTINAAPIFYNNYVVSARINRFNFPLGEFSEILRNKKINLIINDVIELTSNFQQMFNIEFGYKPKIISNIRHLDDVINHYYMHRVIDGIHQSDLVTILSETMRNKLLEQIEEILGEKHFESKIITFEPSISYDELYEFHHKTLVRDLDKVIITFPGRLSKGEENRTNWDKFGQAIAKLREKRQDFEVYYTDPNNAQDFNNGIDWIKTIPKDRHQFLNLLNKTDVVVSLMDIEGFGGISIREALLMNCLPIIPYVHEYKKMAPDESYPGYINSPIKVDELALTLDWAISSIKQNNKIKRYDYNFYGRKFVVEEQFKKILPKIEEML
jgi:hypothetical protein